MLCTNLLPLVPTPACTDLNRREQVCADTIVLPSSHFWETPYHRHEKLIYDEESDKAMSTLAERFSSMGTGLRGWLGRTKTM
jgi:hypothetical protein